MFQTDQDVTDNVFDVLLGTSKLKWDPFWNFLHWLCSEGQGHQMGNKFAEQLLSFAFGTLPAEYEITQELNLGPAEGAVSKHPDFSIASPSTAEPTDLLLIMDDLDKAKPGDSRKVNNLVTYCNQAKERVGRGTFKLLVVTNTEDFGRFAKLQDQLSDAGFEVGSGWDFLSTRMMGRWIGQDMAKSDMLTQFVAWVEEHK